jgi:cytochrome c oxidase subunit 2
VATLSCFLVFFGWGAYVYLRTHEAPRDALEVTVVAKQWMWKFEHPDGHRELDELHVPVGKPVLLTMTSQDVIHSLFVPDFRIKQDVLPGRYTRVWFEATTPGEYDLFCTQYCGTSHAGMSAKVVALPPSEYQAWLQSGIARVASTGSDRGRKLYERMACVSCHGGGSQVRAPSLGGVFAKPVHLSDGQEVVADENYLRESILNPQAKIVAGYDPLMPSFAGMLSEDDVLDLIAYLKAGGPREPKRENER